jgi:hypothetical protein
MTAMHVLMERLMSRGQLNTNLELQEIRTIKGIAKESRIITRVLANDACIAAERQALANLLKARLELINLNGVEARLLRLEKLQKKAA